MINRIGRIVRVVGLLVVLVFCWLPARAVADSAPSRSRISVGGGVGVMQLLHLDASYWVTERVTIDVRAWGFIVFMFGVDAHVTYRVPFSRTGSFLLQGGGGRVSLMDDIDCPSCEFTATNLMDMSTVAVTNGVFDVMFEPAM